MSSLLKNADRIKSLGFRVFVAERGDYGFITDKAGSRVMSFDSDGSLSGQYGPPSKESGTGWRMVEQIGDLQTAEQVDHALNTRPPAFAGKGWRYLTNLTQYLAAYDESSRFGEV